MKEKRAMKKQSRRVLTASVSNDVELDAGEEVIIKCMYHACLILNLTNTKSVQNVLERVPSSTARNADEEKRKRKRGQEVSQLIENLSAYERVYTCDTYLVRILRSRVKTKQSNLLARIDVDSLSKISSDKNSEMMKEVAETKKLGTLSWYLKCLG